MMAGFASNMANDGHRLAGAKHLLPKAASLTGNDAGPWSILVGGSSLFIQGSEDTPGAIQKSWTSTEQECLRGGGGAAATTSCHRKFVRQRSTRIALWQVSDPPIRRFRRSSHSELSN